MAGISEGSSGAVTERYVDKFKSVITDSTTARTVGAADIEAFVICSNAAAVTVTIPDSTTAAGKVFPIGTVIGPYYAAGAGGLTIAKTGADTLTGTATAATGIARRAIKVSATGWYAFV